MNIDDLNNPELQEKLKGCKTTEDVINLVQTEGVDLTQEQLKALAGGVNEWEVLTGQADPDGQSS